MEVTGIIQSSRCFNVKQHTPVPFERDAGCVPTDCLVVWENRIDYLREVILFRILVKLSELR